MECIVCSINRFFNLRVIITFFFIRDRNIFDNLLILSPFWYLTPFNNSDTLRAISSTLGNALTDYCYILIESFTHWKIWKFTYYQPNHVYNYLLTYLYKKTLTLPVLYNYFRLFNVLFIFYFSLENFTFLMRKSFKYFPYCNCGII